MEKDSETEWYVAERPGCIRALKKRTVINKIKRGIERSKASIRAKVEHPSRVIKCHQFGFTKARYRGLAKNDSQLAMLFAISNLFQSRHKPLWDQPVCCALHGLSGRRKSEMTAKLGAYFAENSRWTV